jgi:hypothetical protein
MYGVKTFISFFRGGGRTAEKAIETTHFLALIIQKKLLLLDIGSIPLCTVLCVGCV